jgi:hypothetical protein
LWNELWKESGGKDDWPALARRTRPVRAEFGAALRAAADDDRRGRMVITRQKVFVAMRGDSNPPQIP